MTNRIQLIKGLITEVQNANLTIDPWDMADLVAELWRQRYDDLGLGGAPDEDEVLTTAFAMRGGM